MSRQHVEAVRSSLDGWNRGDVDAWLESSHPEIEWVSEVALGLEGADGVFRGTTALRRFWDEWHSIWNVTIDVQEILDLGDTVLAIAQVRTRAVGSGIDIEGPVAYVFEFEGPLARRARAYLDLGEARRVVGLSE